jgi:hypothetical protein
LFLQIDDVKEADVRRGSSPLPCADLNVKTPWMKLINIHVDTSRAMFLTYLVVRVSRRPP